MKIRDLEIGLAFRQVRDSVLKATANAQEPHTYGSLSGKPYFLAGGSQEVNVLAAADRLNAWGRLKSARKSSCRWQQGKVTAGR